MTGGRWDGFGLQRGVRAYQGVAIATVDPKASTITLMVELAKEYDDEENEMHDNHDHDHSTHSGTTVDPVCKMSVDPASAAASREHDGKTVSFCSKGCAAAFDADPTQYATA